MLPNKSRTTIPENGPKRNPHVVPEPSPQTPQVSVNYLSRILDRKLEEIARLRKRSGELEASAAAAPSARSWVSALRRPGEVALIAELKRRAPSAGELRPEMDPASLARSYESAGAAALSVLTDLDFAGQLSDMEEARSAVSLPTLRSVWMMLFPCCVSWAFFSSATPPVGSTLANPQSMTCTSPNAPTMMLAGLRSR